MVIKSAIFFMSLFVLLNTVSAQYDITVGTGTKANSSTRFPCPLQDTFTGSRSQYLFRASELNALGMDSGTITSVAFFVTKLNSYFGTVEGLSVKMGTTTATTLGATTWVANMKTVYTAKDLTVKTGKNILVFDTTFDWNGLQNLVLEVCNGSAIGTGTSNPSVLQTVLTFNASRTYAATTAGGSLCAATNATNSDSSQLVRPVTTFNWVPFRYCDAVPVVGNVTASSLTVCPSIPLTLTSKGGTYASLITYQWQVLNPVTGLWDDTDPLDNQLSLTVFQDTTHSYRLKAFCGVTGDSAFSNIVTVTTPKVPGGNHYIINKNHTGNVWPLSDTFKSFNATVTAMSCGIKSAVTFTVLPGSGPYNEQMIVNGKILNSSDVNTITYKGNGETITFNPTTNSRAVIKLKGAKYFTFDSLTVNAGTGGFGIGFQLQNNADSNVIKNCIIKCPAAGAGYTTLAASAGVVVGGTDASAVGLDVASLCDHVSVIGNKISGGAVGISVAAGASGENTEILVKDNNIKDFYQHGIYVNGTYNTTVEHNTISRPTATVSPTTLNGIYVTSLDRTLRIVRNRIHSPFASQLSTTSGFNGINLDGANAGSTPAAVNEFHLANNLIYNIQGDGLQCGINNNNTSNVQLYHNTVALDDDLGNPVAAAATTRCYSQGATPSSITIVNNLFTIKRGGTAAKHCIYVGSSTATNFKDLSYNNYLNDAANGTANYIGYWATNRLTIGDWITASNEVSALNIQPVYALSVVPDMDTANLNPTNAALDNKGKAVYEKIDILGTTTSRIDIGCYEFIPPPCLPSSLNGLTEIYVGNKKVFGDTTICEGTPVAFKLKITGATGSSTTYQWEKSLDSSNVATYTNFGASLIQPDTVFTSQALTPADTTFFYRCKLSCQGADYYTNWRKMTVIPAMITGDYYINLDSATRYLPGAANGMFTDYTTAIAKMKYCGVKGNGPAVRFNVQAATAGDYAEQIKIDSITGVTATRRVVFKGNNTTIKFPVSGPSANAERALIKLDRAHFITLDSIVVDASAPTNYAYGIQLINNADSNAILNCTIKNNNNLSTTNFAGIVIGATATTAITSQNSAILTCDSNTISNNKISGGYYGITLAGSTTNLLFTTKITKNTIQDFYSTGIYVAGCRNVLVEANNISRPTRIGAAYGLGISFAAAPSFASWVQKNRVFGFYESDKTSVAGASGIHFNSVDATAGNEIKVVNNAIYNLGGAGIVYGLHNIGSDNILYYHNSISVEDTTVAASTGITAGFYQTTAATGLVFKNNIIHVKRAGTAEKSCINLQAVGATGTTIEANNNDYSINTYLSSNYVGRYGTGPAGLKKLLGDWKAASAQDANSVSYDPLYVDSKNGDLHPQFYLLDNLAINGLATDDILNLPRANGTPNNSDIGAYEFNVPPCPSPLLAGTAVVTPSSGICLEVPISLTLIGNSPVGQINFQWQDSAAGVPGWSNLGPLNYSPDYDTVSSIRNYYRCIVTCAASGASVISATAVLNLNPLLPAGTYTIDCNLPTTPAPYNPGDNFNNFNDAITAMQCGIIGSVIFDVKPCTYNEQVRVPYIAGTGPNKTITFQGFNNNVGGATLTYAPTSAAANYTLRYDSAMYVTFKNLNIENTNSANARVVDFRNKSSNCALVNCNITTSKVVATTNTASAIFADQFKGNNLLIKGNNILYGANGIYLTGVAATAGNLTNPSITIDSNTITRSYGSGLHLQFTNKLSVTRNKVVYNGEVAAASSGIFASYCDSGMIMKNNSVTIDSVNGAVFGIQVINSRNKSRTGFGQINGNQIYANSGNAGKVVGLAIITSDSLMVKNNVIAINSAGAASYGLQNTNNVANTQMLYYNNTIQVTVPDTTCIGALLTQTPAGKFVLNNNIISNIGGGKTMTMNPVANFTSNYNMLYTTGKVLVGTLTPTAYHLNITAWRKASNQDKFSIVYKPSFKSKTDLQPNLDSSDVWAMHGRGTQITGNIKDINDNSRPEKLTDGVPDLGAYEFYPNVDPPILPSIPTTPSLSVISPTKEQIFYFGSDTVMRIKWDSLTPPATCDVRRFSGVVGKGITAQANCDSMFFYTKVDVPGGYSKGNVKLYYIDPWLGSFPNSSCNASVSQIALGKTNPINIWGLGRTSRGTSSKRLLYEDDVQFFDRFTGLFCKECPPPPPCGDTSNAGHEFWVAYPMHNQDLNGGNSSTFILYLAAQNEGATVTVSIGYPNPVWTKTYVVAPGAVVVTDPIPHTYQHQLSGVYDDAIHIESDENIVAYAHCWASSSSGATMLMPICTWGYEYKMLSKHEKQTTDARSYYFVVAKEDNTRISYCSVVPNLGLLQSGDTVLNKGQWFQVFANSDNDDLSGSVVKSIANDKGVCYPIAFFSGDMRTYTANGCFASSGDFAMQQNFPASAWGKKYLTAPTSNGNAQTRYKNWFRIGLKDANQNVFINNQKVYPTGTPPPSISNYSVSSTFVCGSSTPSFIEFSSDTGNYITSDKPMTIAQFLGSSCGAENGDPDMVYISPIEQGINEINFYRNSDQTILENFLTLIGSTADVPSICEIQAANGPCVALNWTYIYKHPHYPGKSIYIKYWPSPPSKRQVHVKGDSIFTAVTYGLGSVESYMYNAGTNILSYFTPDSLQNEDANNPNAYTCSGTKFRIKVSVANILPDSIKFLISHIPGITPNQDVVIKKPYIPAPTFTLRANGDTVWSFTLDKYYIIDTPGTYTLVYQIFHPDIEGCDKKLEFQKYIQVLPSPKIGFTYSPNPICPNTMVNFFAGKVDSTTFIPVYDWSWSSSPYGIKADTLKSNTFSFFYSNAGTDTVKLHTRTADYCVGDTSLVLTINPNPVVNVVKDSIHTCAGGNVTFNIQSPLAGAVYTMYDAPTGGNIVQTDTTFTFTNVTADATYYISCVSATGCTSVDRKAVKIKVTQLPVPTAAPTTITACIGTSATFDVTNVQPNVVYNWFDVATGGSSIAAGNSFNIPNVTASATYYLEASENGCVSTSRFPVSLIAATPPSLAVVSNAVTVCASDAATFSVQTPDPTVTYNWYTTATGGTATSVTSYTINPANTSASYWVSATSANGCTTPRLQVDLTVKIRPVVTIVYPDSVTLCKGLRQTFCVQNPLAGAKYKWYNQSLGGVLVQADSTCFTTPPLVQGDTTYYVDGEKDGCTSFTRATVKIKALQELDTTSVTGTKVETNFIRFDWTAVPNATGYKITITLNGGAASSVTYSAGTLTHTINNLKPGDTAWATVVALGINPCQNSTSRPAFGKTVLNETFYPNVFTPNGDGKNDKIVICGSSFKDIQYSVFNQWGEKIWEVKGLVPTDTKGCYLLWDGTQRGVLQPVGVYMFASKITFLDGKVEEKKGTINLIR